MSQHVFKLAHEFDAPQAMVFDAFATEEALNAWWGPTNSRNTTISLDFRPGGTFHYRMESEQGTMYARFLYKTIQPHNLLVFTIAFTDANANVVPAPFPNFPREIEYTFRFTEASGKTKIDVTGVPVQANEVEAAAFRSLNESMQQGFGGSLKKLAAYLSA
ncbi:SRPBCC domain-containing protein [Chitinophaga horti]|uniref:SRPBCC domain-containing protein n=1 Tax=Chitinophaga horti TaxID=2920382 RepID=A0ABY6J481_9BACT|nr:SRPBCC domain-containing protein [Chitinophaga horti]UYQ94478.1 SRPBCC domain-containing protein [Chitinophaga horti]